MLDLIQTRRDLFKFVLGGQVFWFICREVSQRRLLAGEQTLMVCLSSNKQDCLLPLSTKVACMPVAMIFI